MGNAQEIRGSGRRFRLRGAFSGKSGRRAGLASLFVPLAGYVIQDLRKPDSTVKALAQRAYAYLTRTKIDRQKAIDPAGRVEVIETKTTSELQKLDKNQD